MAAVVKREKRELNSDDLFSLLHLIIREKGLNGDAIHSMNDFYGVGMPQIIKSIFKVEETILNTRDKTPADRAIEKIRVLATFTRVELALPETNGYISGKQRPITPLTATLEDRNFSANAYIDATIEAWAYEGGPDGKVHHRIAEVKNKKLSAIPMCVGARGDNISDKSRKTLEMLHENPADTKGYFIVAGREWSIDNMESVANNKERIFMNYWRTEVCRLEFISKPGDTYQNSKQNIVRMLNNGCITIELGSPQLRGVTFPFYMIFRALGVANDREMLDYILQAPIGTPSDRNTDPLVNALYDMIQTALVANYDTKTNKFEQPAHVHGQVPAITYLIRKLSKDTFRDMDLNREDHLRQAVGDFLRFLDDNLPHIGEHESVRIRKARYYGRLIRRMLMTVLGILPPTDRDSYVDKRVHTPGILLAKVFKTHFGHLISQARKHLAKDFKSMPFATVNLAQSLNVALNMDLERLLTQSITSGNQATLTINMVRKYKNRLSSQLRDNKNPIKNMSIGRMIISPSADAAKNSNRAKEMRMPHLSFLGYGCLIQSPEGGDKVGLHKQLAISASITSYGVGEVLKTKLLADREHVVPLDAVHSHELVRMRPVYVNGEWIGCTPSTHALVERYVELRRAGEIIEDATIQWDNNDDEVYFWVDYGRPRRPLLIVVNNIRDWRFLGLPRPAEVKDYEQHLVLTHETVRDIYAGSVNVDELRRRRVYEWITPGEQIRLDIAANIELLKTHQYNPLRQFTHCDIPESMLGIVANLGLMNNYNHTPRNTFFTSQDKQAGGEYVQNWAYRVDKDCFLQYQMGLPLAFTRMNNYVPPLGDNTITAIMVYSGYNEEDSQVWAQWVTDRMKFNGCWFNYDKIDVDKTEQLMRPVAAKTSGIRNYARYNLLDEKGIIPVGTVVHKNDVVVGKVRRHSKQVMAERKMEWADASHIYKSEFPAIVHNVIIAKDDNAMQFVKIAYRQIKPVVVGDKFSSRAGQKGICGMITPQGDMPFTEDGIVPHILMNPNSFPKRMTNGHLFEIAASDLCAQRGTRCDLSPFRNIDIDDLSTELKRAGLEPFGRRRLYSGITGHYITALIYMGPVNYLRLQKFVTKSVYSIDVGPTDIITRQPLDGKASNGGLRLSELVRDVFLAHGCPRFMSEKMFDHSDGFRLEICRCGYRAILNLDENLYKCKRCGDMADINTITTCWSSKQFLDELNAMNIGTRVYSDPPTYYSD